jgi:signal transduction histidine kinase
MSLRGHPEVLRIVTRSIRNKLALVVLVTTLAALTVAGIAMVIYDLRTYERSGVSDLVAQAEILGRASAPALDFEDPKSASEYLMLLKARPDISAAAIYNVKGKLFASYTRRDLDLPVPGLPATEGARIEGRDIVLFKRIVRNNEILGTVYIKADFELRQRLIDYLGIFAGVTMLSLMVALLLWTWLQGVFLRPILATSAVARQVVESRDYSLRVKKTTSDEIGDLVDAFNDMVAEVGRRSDALQASNRTLEHEVAERLNAQDELRRLNAELEQRVADRTTQLAAANKELEGFSYSVSHDLRAPVRAISGFSRMLLEDHGDQLDDEARRKLGVLQSEASRMGTLIDDLLAFSRLGRQAIQKSELDMKELARAVFEGLRAQHQGPNPEFRLGSLPRGMGDKTLLGQVWINLLGNALKFSAKREKPLIEVSAVSDAKEYIYFVRDNGAGFDPRYQSKLFGVFQRLHDASEFPGTGVGLALVQRIVVRHGGRIWAEGKPEEGATFYFTLPKENNDGNH